MSSISFPSSLLKLWKLWFAEFGEWCSRADSNRDALRHRLLRPACLPIPSREHGSPKVIERSSTIQALRLARAAGQLRTALSQRCLERAPAGAGRSGTGRSGKEKNARIKKGATIAYLVKPGDTLMKISFEVFGDLRRWREIYNLTNQFINKRRCVLLSS